MDAFFAAVEERDRPRLKGLPIVVGADPVGGRGRGVVSTANYAARAYGIRSALPIGKAWEFSEAARRTGKPAAVFLEVAMGKYGAVSAEVMGIVRNRIPQVEQVGVDEAYLDLTFTGSYENAEALAREIKASVRKKERLTCSIGIAPNKLIAKIASDREKPDGLTVVHPEEVLGFLAPLPVRALPGVGPKTEARLSERKIRTVGEARSISKAELQELFGKWGSDLYEKARGVDDAPVAESDEVKSIGEQETFEKDTRDLGFLSGRLKVLAAGVWKHFEASGFARFRTVVLTVRFEGFETKTRSYTPSAAITNSDALGFEALRMLMPFLDHRENPRTKRIRLLGVRVEKLE